MFLTGKDFAFLRAFAIPSISKVSVAAREMIHRTGKRYADTTALVGEFLINPLDSERAQIALNRMNWIHSRYGSTIQNPQMVYTLCLLTCEAIRWIDMYDWRKTTPLEKHASYVYWKEVGKRMGLVDIPESYEACAKFIRDFEEHEMSPWAARIAMSVIHLYQSTIPKFLAPLVKLFILAFMDSKVAGTFCLPSTETWLVKSTKAVLEWVLYTRAFIVRNFFFPRQTTVQIFAEMTEKRMRHMTFWEIEPWYVAKSNKITLYSLYCKIFALPVAGDKERRTEGYKLQELGPKKYEGKGGKDIMDLVEKSKTGGCPYSTFGWTPTGTCPYMARTEQTLPSPVEEVKCISAEGDRPSIVKKGGIFKFVFRLAGRSFRRAGSVFSEANPITLFRAGVDSNIFKIVTDFFRFLQEF